MAMTTITVTVSETRKPVKQKLEKLAETLGCRVSDLVWHALNTMLKAPPKTAPEGSSQVIGTSAGFWILHKRHATTKRVVSIGIQEVLKRSEVKKETHTFFRYKKGDAKSRTRALKQAKRAAEYDKDLANVKDSIRIQELQQKRK